MVLRGTYTVCDTKPVRKPACSPCMALQHIRLCIERVLQTSQCFVSCPGSLLACHVAGGISVLVVTAHLEAQHSLICKDSSLFWRSQQNNGQSSEAYPAWQYQYFVCEADCKTGLQVVGDSSCPIVDTWWQTETGSHLITPLPAI